MIQHDYIMLGVAALWIVMNLLGATFTISRIISRQRERRGIKPIGWLDISRTSPAFSYWYTTFEFHRDDRDVKARPSDRAKTGWRPIYHILQTALAAFAYSMSHLVHFIAGLLQR